MIVLLAHSIISRRQKNIQTYESILSEDNISARQEDYGSIRNTIIKHKAWH